MPVSAAAGPWLLGRALSFQSFFGGSRRASGFIYCEIPPSVFPKTLPRKKKPKRRSVASEGSGQRGAHAAPRRLQSSHRSVYLTFTQHCTVNSLHSATSMTRRLPRGPPLPSLTPNPPQPAGRFRGGAAQEQGPVSVLLGMHTGPSIKHRSWIRGGVAVIWAA